MIGERVLVAGTKIRYKMYVRPFEFRTGVIIGSTPDRDKEKLAKYLIQLKIL